MDESGEVRQDGHERARDGPTRQLPAGSQGDEREQPQKHGAYCSFYLVLIRTCFNERQKCSPYIFFIRALKSTPVFIDLICCSADGLGLLAFMLYMLTFLVCWRYCHVDVLIFLILLCSGGGHLPAESADRQGRAGRDRVLQAGSFVESFRPRSRIYPQHVISCAPAPPMTLALRTWGLREQV